jgi:phosphocarrier protein
MPERTLSIRNKTGLHMRPAEKIVHLASKFQSEVTIVKDGLEVNGKSILGVMMLAAEYGSEITIRADGPDAEKILEALTLLIDNRFEEPE